MSINYSTNLVVGWTITDEDIPKKFIKKGGTNVPKNLQFHIKGISN